MTSVVSDRKRPFANPLVWVLLFFSSGIFVDRVFDSLAVPWLVGVWTAAVVWSVAYRWQRFAVSGVCLAVLFVSLGGAWHHTYWNEFPTNEISNWATTTSSPVAIEGVILSEPSQVAAPPAIPLSVASQTPRFLTELRASRIRIGEEWQSCSGRVRVSIDGDLDVVAGDSVRVMGDLKAIEGTRNPGEFDFLNYYRSRRVLAWVYINNPDGLTKISTNQSQFTHWRSHLRSRLKQEISSRVSPEQSALATAILLGSREQLSQDDRRDFVMTGTVHVLAISGLHVGILSSVLFGLMRLLRVSRKWNLLFAVLFVVFYAWLVEFRAPVTRAMILIICVCVSRFFGRAGFSLNVLALAGLIVLAVNPADLFVLGPQLSFLAVFAISMFAERTTTELDPVIKLVITTRDWPLQWLRYFRNQLWKGVLVSAMIWLVTVPLVARYFHLFAPSALWVNPLVLVPMFLALVGGLMIMLGGGWLGPMAILGGWLCGKSLALIQMLVGWGSVSRWGHFWTSGPSDLAVVSYYLLLGAICFFRPFANPRRALIAFSVAWIGLAWLGPAAWMASERRSPKEYWTATIVDVGHGSSALVELPGGERILYDAGSFGSVEAGARNVSSVLWSEGIERIDALIISHADVDHFNAVPQLCERFSIGVVYIPQHLLDSKDDSVGYLLERLEAADATIKTLLKGNEMHVTENTIVRVLGPGVNSGRGSDNSQSIVVEIRACGRTLILPGDIEPPGLEPILQMQGIDADVIMAPHHGSGGSHPKEFSAWCQPELVVISGMQSRINERSVQEFESNHCVVASTGDLGAIRIRLSEKRVLWQSWILDNRPFGRSRFGTKWHSLSQKDDNVRQMGRLGSTNNSQDE